MCCLEDVRTIPAAALKARASENRRSVNAFADGPEMRPAADAAAPLLRER